MLQTLLMIAIPSYLLGSIPFGYLLVRIVRGEDVRQSGSGNIGATNVSRKSPALGVATLLLDALKGTAAVALSSKLMSDPTWPRTGLFLGAALFAVIGHIFPVWLKFRGGKGVATGLGAFLVATPKPVLVAAAIFLLIVVTSRYVALGSILAVASLPFLQWTFDSASSSPMREIRLIPTALACLLIIARHHENVRRLLAGTENRFGASHA